MNIFNKTALRGLKKNRTQTIVTIVGVVLSSALITAVVTFGISLLDYMAAGAAEKYGGWHVAFENVSSSFVQERAGDREAADTVTVENIGYAALEGAEDSNKPYLYLAGFDQESFDALPLVLYSGRLPENSSEILVPGHAASNGGVELAIGDTIALSVGNRRNGNETLGQYDPRVLGETLEEAKESVYTVVGMVKQPDFEEDTSPGYTVITRSDESVEADSFTLFVTLKNPREIHSYAAKTAGEYHFTFHNTVLRFMGLSDDPGDKLFNALLYTVGGIVIVIIMTGSVFLIYNAFGISLNERTQQIGILSSVGATAKQIRNSVLFEGLIIGSVGIPIGVCVGLGGIWLVILFVSRNFGSILYSGATLTLQVSAPAIAGAALISLITILISAYLPAKKAARVPVMECIRQTNEVKVEAGTVKTGGFSQRVYGLEGTLALKNFKRNKKRYRSTVLSLVLSIVLFVAAGAFTTNLKQVMAGNLAFTTYEIGFGTKDMDDRELLSLYDKLKTAKGVTESSYQSVMEYLCAVPADELTDQYWKETGEPSGTETVNSGNRSAAETVELPMQVLFVDDSTYLEILASTGLPAEEYTKDNAKCIAVAKLETVGREKKGEKDVDDFHNLFQSASVSAVFMPMENARPDQEQGKNITITCVETVPPDIPPTKETSAYSQQHVYYFEVIAPWSQKEKFISDTAPAGVRVKGMTFSSDNPSQSAAEMKAMIQEAGISSAYLFFNVSEIMEENRNYIFITNVFAYTFILMISLIAAANVFNTVSTNIRLRRRELAMLRSVGMSDRDFNKMMRFECAFYGMRALLFGLPLAVLLSWLIYRGMFAGGAEGIVFELPWASLGISVASVLLVIFATMMYAVSQIRKENIIDVLRDEMT